MPRTAKNPAPAAPAAQRTELEVLLEIETLLKGIHAMMLKEKNSAKRAKRAKNNGKIPESVYYAHHKEEIRKKNPDAQSLVLFKLARDEYKKLTDEQKQKYIDEAKNSSAAAVVAATLPVSDSESDTGNFDVKVDEPAVTTTTTTTTTTPAAAPPAAEAKKPTRRQPGTVGKK